MLVQCPSCRTTYKVADEVVKGAAPAFRCSRCKHTFELEGAEATPATAEKTAPTEAAAEERPEERELSFSFPPATPPEPEPEAALEAEPSATMTKSPAVEANFTAGEQWSLHPAPLDQSEERPFTMTPTVDNHAMDKTVDLPEDFAAGEPDFPVPPAKDLADSPANILAMTSYIDQRASIRPYLSLFALLLIGFSLLAAMTHAKPAAMENLVKQIPFVGATVLKNNHLKDGILLKSLRTSFESIQGNREVLVLSGVAINQNPVVIREVKVTGKVYKIDGKELERQTIWIGNTISPKIIRGMTAEDIPHLQDLKPLKTFELPPGDSIRFTVVFLKPAKQVKDFSLEVLLADGEV